MGLFDFLKPDVNQGAMNRQSDLAAKASADTELQRKKALKGQEAGYNKAIDLSQLGTDLFKGVTDDRQRATDMYMNSLGLNGQAGNDAALGAFQHGPGYDLALQEGQDSYLRRAANTGSLNSGDTARGLFELGRGLQNQEYGQWQDRLHGLDVLPAAQVYGTQLGNQGQLQVGKGNSMAQTRLGFAPLVAGNYNNQASLIGQQESMKMAADQQGINGALGLFGGITSMLSPAFGKGGMFGA